MKSGISLLAIVALSSLATVPANASGPNREPRSVADFEAIEVGGSIDLQVQQGAAFLVEVESPDGPASDLLTEVRGGSLRLSYDKPWFPLFFDWGRHRFTVHVTLPRLVSLYASGGSNVSSQGTITGDRLDLATSGGARMRLDIAQGSLDVRTSGGSHLWLTGSTGTANLRSSGGSNLDASGLKAESAHLSSSGGSDISIGESGTLVANASGGSDIRYSGEPRSLEAHTSGGGGIKRAH